MKTNEIALTVVFSSLYAVLVIVLAPISFGPVQLRVADCLIPLAALFGWPAIVGVTAGCFVGNTYFLLGPEDIILGTIANLIAATIIFMLRKRALIACVLGSLPIGVIVGSYLWIFYGFTADIFGLQIAPIAGMIISVTISTLIAVAVLGYSILITLARSSVIQDLKSRGLKIYSKK